MATQRTPQIVNLVANLLAAAKPSGYQQSGALVSVGGTTLSTGTLQFVSSASEALGYVGTSGNYTEVTNMINTFFSQGSAVGVYLLELGAITTPNDGPAALKAWDVANPNQIYAYLVPADWDTITPPGVPTLSQTAGGTRAAQTYYVKVAYVNATGEIGELSAESTLAVSADFLLTVSSPAASPSITVSGSSGEASEATGYMVYASNTSGTETLQTTTPISIGTSWTEPTTGLVTGTSANLTLADLASEYSGPTAQKYFITTSSAVNCASYGTISNSVFSGYKAAITVVPSVNAASTEFQAASVLYQFVVNNPGAASILAPMQYRFVYGVTPWPDGAGYGAILDYILEYNGSYIGSSSQGGLSNAMIVGGTTSSGAQQSWWIGMDWEEINIQQAVTAAVIQGSNQQPPLLYTQGGINTLEGIAQQTADNGVTFGAALSAVVTATPFATYIAQNPNDYANGVYNGLAATIVGQNGFLTLTFNLTASELPAA